jgi:hypothetical protein
MFVPEYVITNKMLRYISHAEYCKALIENTTVLPVWEGRLQKETRVRTIDNALIFNENPTDNEQIKKYVDNLTNQTSQEVKNLSAGLDFIENEIDTGEFDEKRIKDIHSIVSLNITKPGVYRSKRLSGHSPPEEILADIVALADWYNSLDARETHPIILAGLVKARLEIIAPFEKTGFLVSNLITRLSLKLEGWEMDNYFCLEEYYSRSKQHYKDAIDSASTEEEDYTSWLEYFTEGFSHELSNIKEKVMLMARDTKVAKAAGRVRLTERQERIVTHLQDYGILQNKDFTKIFPDVSEDSVLRDLKVLMDQGIVIKTGSTKSSRYELT